MDGGVPHDWLQIVLQGGSFTVLITFFGYMLKVMIPQQRIDTIEAEKRRDLRDQIFMAAIDKVHADCAKEREATLAAFQRELAEHREDLRDLTQAIHANRIVR